MVVRKYETDSELKELKTIIKDNQVRLCSAVRTGVNPDYSAHFNNAVIGYVDSSGNTVNGFIIGRIYYGKAYLELVCAESGSGIGKALIGNVTRWFKSKGYESIDLLPANNKLVPYYEKLGYTCTKTNGYGEVTCMRKELYPSAGMDSLTNNMSNLRVNNTQASSSSQSLPRGCAALKKYAKNDLNDYYADELKDFVNKCSLFDSKVTTKAAAMSAIKAAIRKYI